jgi:hypothetical protein
VNAMGRFTVYPAQNEWCVGYETLLLVSYGSRELAEQAASNLAQAAVKKGESLFIEIRREPQAEDDASNRSPPLVPANVTP